MRLLRFLPLVAAVVLLGACVPEQGGGGTPTTTTTTTAPPLPTLTYTGTAGKTLGCFSGAGGNDSFHVDLGDDGWWDFYFQGCSLGATETVALWDPLGGPVADAFQSPTGYACMMSIDGTSDHTGWFVDSVTDFGNADTGGLIFLSSTNAWPNSTGWTVTCMDKGFPLPQI